MSKAKTLAGTVSTGGVLATPGSVPASAITGLATVATSGAYADLSGKPTLPAGDVVGTTDAQTLTNKTLDIANNTLTGVQPTLVSGTNIKTINGTSLLGSGNIAISASPTLEAVASGSLANGDKVIVNADGTVSVISATIVPTSFGSPAVFTSGYAVEPSVAYDANAQKVVVAYWDPTASDRGYAVVGTVSGSSISFGSVVQVTSVRASGLVIAYDASAQKVVIAYRLIDSSGHGAAIVGTVSGTSISFGTPVVFTSTSTSTGGIAYDANAQKVVISYTNSDNASRATAVVGTVSGTSISFGTPVVYTTSDGTSNTVAYDSNSQKMVFVFRDGANSNRGTGIVGTVSGTSISFGTKAAFSSGSASSLSVAYDSDAQKVVVAYEDGANSNHGTACVGTVSGTGISFGTPVVFEAAAADDHSVSYDANAKKIVIAYVDNGNSQRGTAVVGTVSGSAISFGSPVVFASGSTGSPWVAYDQVAQKSVIAYRNGSSTDDGTSVVFQAGYTNTNLTATNFIGISNGAYANAATATIQVSGAVDDAQSSLTAGQAYYVQVDGTLSITPGSPSVFAGTAVASTKLIVKG
jgi:hypothetical protein